MCANESDSNEAVIKGYSITVRVDQRKLARSVTIWRLKRYQITDGSLHSAMVIRAIARLNGSTPIY